MNYVKHLYEDSDEAGLVERHGHNFGLATLDLGKSRRLGPIDARRTYRPYSIAGLSPTFEFSFPLSSS